jgi:hypothetical protein
MPTMQSQPNLILNESAVSGNVTSKTVIPGDGRRLSLDLRTTGTLAGTFKLQAKNDPRKEIAFQDYTYTWGSQPSGSAWTILIQIDPADFLQYQVVFTYASGTGNITCAINLF